MLSLLKNKKVQAEKMATSKEKPSPSLKNCKQAFSEQEWDQARQSSNLMLCGTKSSEIIISDTMI